VGFFVETGQFAHLRKGFHGQGNRDGDQNMYKFSSWSLPSTRVFCGADALTIGILEMESPL
jgi:hypothetical protein